jgi:hypothetical protein
MLMKNKQIHQIDCKVYWVCVIIDTVLLQGVRVLFSFTYFYNTYQSYTAEIEKWK